MLFRRRKQVEARDAAELNGESFWTTDFEESLRNKLTHVVLKLRESGRLSPVATHARQQILMSEGLLFLHSQYEDHTDALLNYLLQVEPQGVPDVIEALAGALEDRRVQYESGIRGFSDAFHEVVNSLLQEHRVSFELIDGQMVEFESRELHAEVVAPVLTLLGGRAGFEAAEKAYQDALGELSDHQAGNAVTDAGTALQEALGALGCEGNALGPMIKNARKRGLLAPHDGPMLDQFVRILDWVSADRSEKGDGHTAKEPSVEDAWFTVHVVGAVILRLTGTGRPRGAT